MKVMSDFCPLEPQENCCLKASSMSLCHSSQEDIIQKLTTTCLSVRTRTKCWIGPISASVLVRTGLVQVQVKRELPEKAETPQRGTTAKPCLETQAYHPSSQEAEAGEK